MDITNIFNEQQKTIFKNYLEDTFYESGPTLNIDHEHVWNAVMNTPGFAPEDKRERAEFEATPEMQEFTDKYFTAGRHQRLTTYEGYQEFLGEEVGINIQDRGISAEMQAMMDETNNDYSTYKRPRDAQNAPESNPAEHGAGESSKEGSKERITSEMRDQLIKELKENQMRNQPASEVSEQSQNEPSGDSTLNERDKRSLANGRKMEGLSDTIGTIPAGATVMAGVLANRMTRGVGSIFSSAGAGIQQGIMNSRDKRAEKTGKFEDRASASRVMNRRMKEIAADNEKLDTVMSNLKGNPSSQDLRAEMVMGSRRLSDRIARTADLAESAGDFSPNLKDRLSIKLEDQASKVKGRLENQDIIKTEYFDNLMESINNMVSKITDLFKKKKGNENEPLAAGPA